MAFWGVEVKSGKPCKQTFEEYSGRRLHLSQATLGQQSTDKRTILKCKVGEGPAIFLCSLIPGVVETCSLDLFFDEDVVFSVVGSGSIHLAGYNDVADSVEDESDAEDSLDDSDTGFFFDNDDGEEEEEDDDGVSEDEGIPFQHHNSGVKIEEIVEELPTIAANEIDNEQIRGDTAIKKSDKLAKKKKRQQQDAARDSTDRGGAHLNESKQEQQNQLAEETCEDAGSNGGREDNPNSASDLKRKHEDSVEQLSKKQAVEGSTPGTDVEPISPVQETVQRPIEEKKAKKKKKKEKKSLEKLGNETPNHIQAANGQTVSANESMMSDQQSLPSLPAEQVVNEKSTTPGKKRIQAVRKYPNGLEIEEVAMGQPDGKQAKLGKKVGMTYIGKLKSNGKIFDSNIGRKPFEFRLGVGDVIKGWDVGVNGMRVGDKRRLTIPPAMGYGPKGVGGIPPNSWLVFDVGLVYVK